MLDILIVLFWGCVAILLVGTLASLLMAIIYLILRLISEVIS